MRRTIAFIACLAFMLQGASLAADEATAEQLAARAKEILDQRSPDFDKARAAIDEALKKHPGYSPALVQKARLVMILGGESEDSLKEAELVLQGARNLDFNYGPAYIWQGYVYMKLDRMADAGQAFFRASKLAPDDPLFLFYNAKYFAKGYGDPIPYYERYLASGDKDPGRRFDAAYALMEHYVGQDRAKADAAFAQVVAIAPNNAALYGDYARDVMIHWVDFDQGERLARKALSMRDYPHARQSISLALYGRWADAKRRGLPASEVAALYEAASRNDPGARMVPSCALEAPKLRFVSEAIEKIRQPGTEPELNC